MVAPPPPPASKFIVPDLCAELIFFRKFVEEALAALLSDCCFFAGAGDGV